MSVLNLEALFQPTSVAVIGASNQPFSIGGFVLKNLLKGGFGGPIMPVHPGYRAVAGVLTYPDVARLPITPDLAIICTPPPTVPDLIAQLGERGTRAAVIITAGLAGQRLPDGRSIQEAALNAARPHGVRLLGPNCVGLLVPPLHLNATFAHADLQAGALAFVSQSGGFCTAVLDWAREKGLGFSHFVSLGDSADVDFGDVLDYLGSSAETTAILLYMESIGADEARKFMSAARMAARNKPVIAIKAGRFAEGARAAASHTGALAGADPVYDAALRRAGILRVFELDELFDAAETLARAKPLRGERLAILTNGGGPGVIAADALGAGRGVLADFSPQTMARLDALLPSIWSKGNPIDMVGDADGARYVKVIEVLLADAGVDALLVMNAPSALAPSEDAARAIVATVQSAERPILTCWLGGEAARRARRVFAAANIPTYETPEHAVRAFLHRVRFGRTQELLNQTVPSAPSEYAPDALAVRAVVEEAIAQGRALLTEPEAKRVLAAYGIPVVPTHIVRDLDEAAARAAGLTPPLALKILSPDITHKSDVGGVALGLDSVEEVRAAGQAMLQRVAKRYPTARLEGFTLQPQIVRPQALELIVGVNTDPVFGPIVLFGRGGTAVEVIADSSVELPPLNLTLARHLIERTRVHRRLRGFRDTPPADLAALALTLTQVSQLVLDHPEIVELDINPLLADSAGIVALDARIRVAAVDLHGRKRLAIRPYPRELEERLTLRDGRTVLVRPIRPEDQGAHERFVESLSAADLRYRFLGVTRDVPRSLVARLTQIDYDREMAFIAIGPINGNANETLAVVRTVADPDNWRASFAVMVRPEVRGVGLGGALMTKLIHYCRKRGIREISGRVLADNAAMLKLSQRLGFSDRLVPDSELRELRLTLA